MEVKITKRKKMKEFEETFVCCPHCSKEIIGTTENQVLYNLNIHIQAKHKERENGK